jgi:hypothetical protein
MQPIQTAADRLAALRTDEQRAGALRGARPSELLDELAAELDRRGASELVCLVSAELDRRAAIRAENHAIVDREVALQERRGQVIETFARGVSIVLPHTGRPAVLIEPARTTNRIDGWYVSSNGRREFYDSNTLADAVLGVTDE